MHLFNDVIDIYTIHRYVDSTQYTCTPLCVWKVGPASCHVRNGRVRRFQHNLDIDGKTACHIVESLFDTLW